ncbi:winged helix-turn-helix domain-containing protein [Streptomyces sp. NPDC002004]
MDHGKWVLSAQGLAPVSVSQYSSQIHIVLAPTPMGDSKAPPLPGPTSAHTPEDPIHVDPDSRLVEVDGRRLELPRLEFDLLAYLHHRPLRVHSRQQLMDAVWPASEAGDRTVDVHISRLRRRLGHPHRQALATVIGVGYKYIPSTL